MNLELKIDAREGYWELYYEEETWRDFLYKPPTHRLEESPCGVMVTERTDRKTMVTATWLGEELPKDIHAAEIKLTSKVCVVAEFQKRDTEDMEEGVILFARRELTKEQTMDLWEEATKIE